MYQYTRYTVETPTYANDSLTLYRTYYREEDKQESIGCIKAINTNDTSYPLSANLNPYWSEFALMKEIWEKGKTTEYIGFDQYHKKFSTNSIMHNPEYIRFRHQSNFVSTVYQQFCYCHFQKDMDNVLDILREKYGENNKYVDYILHSPYMLDQSCFIMKYEIFDKTCEFIFDILDKLDKLHDLNYDKDKYKEYIQYSCDTLILPQHHIDRIQDFNWQKRLFGFIAERLLSAYLYLNYKDKIIVGI